jgi:hypothetical protein
MFCKKCDEMCDKPNHRVYTIAYFKKQILIQMEDFRAKLNKKIKGLLCIIDMIVNEVNKSSIIKQIEDIIPSLSSDAT